MSSNAFVFNGIWFHANFLAKRKGATNCVDLVPKYLFAELVCEMDGYSCVSCVKLEPGEFNNTSFTFETKQVSLLFTQIYLGHVLGALWCLHH